MVYYKYNKDILLQLVCSLNNSGFCNQLSEKDKAKETVKAAAFQYN